VMPKKYTHGESYDERTRKLEPKFLDAQQAQVLELAFLIEDPASNGGCVLAREVLRLIRDRDEAECFALASELRALQLKYPRAYSGRKESTG